jgi:hypothetical protein
LELIFIVFDITAIGIFTNLLRHTVRINNG